MENEKDVAEEEGEREDEGEMRKEDGSQR